MNSRGDPWNRGRPLYAYNANDQLTTEVSSANGTTIYTYDVNGSLTTKANEGKFSYQYGYDLRNRLATANINRQEGSQNVTISSSYAYNTAGIRTRALQTINGITQNRYFLLDDSHTGYAQVFEETAELGGSIVRSYTIGDDVLSQTVAGVTNHLLYDGHGSTRQLTDSNGAVTANYAYDVYGKMLGGNPGVTDGKTSATDLLYAGEQFDPGLQMEYLRARYYDQDNGRFNRLDPFEGNCEDPQSLHKYAYCHADPVNGIDPTGQIALIELVLIIVVIALVAWGGYLAVNTLKGVAAPGTYVRLASDAEVAECQNEMKKWFSAQELNGMEVSNFSIRIYKNHNAGGAKCVFAHNQINIHEDSWNRPLTVRAVAVYAEYQHIAALNGGDSAKEQPAQDKLEKLLIDRMLNNKEIPYEQRLQLRTIRHGNTISHIANYPIQK